VSALEHCGVASQIPFADTTKYAEEIAAAGPNAFHCVVVNFTNAITIIIARPLAAPGRVADRLVTTATRGEVLIGRLFIRIGARMGEYEGF
jgi:hypothetical protein